MTSRKSGLCAAVTLALALSACSETPEAVAPADDMELAEDVDEGTVTDQMDSGAPAIQEGGGRAVDPDGNPNEPVIPESTATPAGDPADVN